VATGYIRSGAALPDRQKTADSVEKVGSSRLHAYRSLKTPLLRTDTRNLNPKSSDQSKDFNLKRVLSVVETLADFFNRIGHKRTFTFNDGPIDQWHFLSV
jgi:hypothetical protein